MAPRTTAAAVPAATAARGTKRAAAAAAAAAPQAPVKVPRVKSIGSKKEVYGGKANKTRGGLVAEDLVQNKRGKVVSKRKSALALERGFLAGNNKNGINYYITMAPQGRAAGTNTAEEEEEEATPLEELDAAPGVVDEEFHRTEEE